MGIPVRTTAIIATTAVLAWSAARLHSQSNEVSLPAPPVVAKPAGAAPVADAPRVEKVSWSGSSHPQRNLFAYVSAPIAVAPVMERAPVPVVQTPQPAPVVEVVAPRAPEPPRFAYRYIGRFGPEAAPLAAFTRDGEVIVRRAGERIDEQFVLVSIGVESVDVRSDHGTQRIAHSENL